MTARFFFSLFVLLVGQAAQAQYTPLLRLDPADTYGGPLSVDRGIVGLRQRLMELRTTASVMQVTAHPDDEQAGLLTYFSRGTGARTALLSLNRGEAGANAVGPELFDALGLLREQELTLAAKHYGLDDLYFTNAVDYGYSKRMAEAARSFDTAAVLREMVEIIRFNQPLVVISRWHGSERDGHGQHQLAGALVPLAVAAASDSTRYPEQLRQLRPWQVKRLLRSNLPPSATPDITIDVGRLDPWLGETYQSLGATGLSLQRSQTSGRRSTADGPSPQRLQWLAGSPLPVAGDVFSGIETSVQGLFTLFSEAAPDSGAALLRIADAAGRIAFDSLNVDDPQAIVPILARGWKALWRLSQLTQAATPNAHRAIDVKLRQFERAIATAISLEIHVIASPPGGDRVVPGDSIPTEITIRHAATIPVQLGVADIVVRGLVTTGYGGESALLAPNVVKRVTTNGRTLSHPALIARPSFRREHIAQNHYAGALPIAAGPLPPLTALVSLTVDGAFLMVPRLVRYRRSDEPFGQAFPGLSIVPPVSLHADPAVRIVTGAGPRRTRIDVDVRGHGASAIEAKVFLSTNDQPITTPVAVTVPSGASTRVPFDVTLPANADLLALTATALVDTTRWTDDITEIVHRDLEPTRLYAKATSRILRVSVVLRPGLRVGYIMGAGDLVPEAIMQLGANVTLLDSTQLSAGNFARYNTIVIGTRAYAVRHDLVRATPSLIEWTRRGGNLVVLYQTPEFTPETMAPFHALLPANAEEVTEQDATVTLLEPEHPLLTWPNRITTTDFDGWIEQRGSKFLTQLATEYTALVETHDTDQAPQRGIWVTANVGRGRWTYVALALHRQVPYAVPGAYRILANLLSNSRR